MVRKSLTSSLALVLITAESRAFDADAYVDTYHSIQNALHPMSASPPRPQAMASLRLRIHDP
jgi:hypothetical protein